MMDKDITAEIEAVESMVDEDADWGSLEDIIDHFYYKGYLHALRWVIGEQAIAKAKGGEICTT